MTEDPGRKKGTMSLHAKPSVTGLLNVKAHA
jgi:hypothetical protein